MKPRRPIRTKGTRKSARRPKPARKLPNPARKGRTGVGLKRRPNG